MGIWHKLTKMLKKNKFVVNKQGTFAKTMLPTNDLCLLSDVAVNLFVGFFATITLKSTLLRVETFVNVLKTSYLLYSRRTCLNPR